MAERRDPFSCVAVGGRPRITRVVARGVRETFETARCAKGRRQGRGVRPGTKRFSCLR